MLQIAAWRTGANVELPKAGMATLREAWDEYKTGPGTKGGKKIDRTASTIDGYDRVLKLHTPAEWWNKPISFITSPMVDKQHSAIRKKIEGDGKFSGHATADTCGATSARCMNGSIDRILN